MKIADTMARDAALQSLLALPATMISSADLVCAFSLFDVGSARIMADVDKLAARAASAHLKLCAAEAVACCTSARRMEIVMRHSLLTPLASSELGSPAAARLLDSLMVYSGALAPDVLVSYADLNFGLGVRSPCGKLLLHYVHKAAACDVDGESASALPQNACDALVRRLIGDAAAAGVEGAVDAVDAWGATPLQLACIASRKPWSSAGVVDALLRVGGADPLLARRYSRWTPLHCCALRGKLELVALLVGAAAAGGRAGDLLLARDAAGFLASDIAARKQYARERYLAAALDVLESDRYDHAAGAGAALDEAAVAARVADTLLRRDGEDGDDGDDARGGEDLSLFHASAVRALVEQAWVRRRAAVAAWAALRRW